MFSLKKPPLPPVLQATGPSKWILFLFVLKVETTSSPPKSILSFFGSQATFPSLSTGEVWSWERQWCVLPPGLAPKNLLQSPLCSFHPLLWLTGKVVIRVSLEIMFRRWQSVCQPKSPMNAGWELFHQFLCLPRTVTPKRNKLVFKPLTFGGIYLFLQISLP